MRGRKLTQKEQIEKLEADKAERKRVFAELLKHIRSGFSLQSFEILSDVTVKKYFREYPEEFCELEFASAMRSGQQCWETIGKRQATGECLGNSRSWVYNMVNRFGWRDRVDVKAEHAGQVQVNVVSFASEKARQDGESKEHS